MTDRGGALQALLIEPRRARPVRRVDVYLMLGATLVACLVYVAALSVQVLPTPGLAVAFIAAAPICALFAWVILVADSRAAHDPALAWVSTGLAIGVVAMVLQLISFPAVSPDGGVLGTGNQSSSGLYLVFHLSLAAGALAGALRLSSRWRSSAAVLGSAFAVLLAVDVVPLPELLRDDASFTPLLIALELLCAAVGATAAVLWVARVGRSAPALHGWVGVALSLSVYDLVLNALGGERFDAVWWGSLSLRVATFVLLAFGSLAAVLGRARETEAYGEAELERREAQLRSSLTAASGLLSSAEQLSRAVTSAQVADVLSANARSVSGAAYASVVVGSRDAPLSLLGADGYDARTRRRLMQLDWDMLLPAPLVLSAGEAVFVDNAREIRTRFPGVVGLPVEHAGALAALPINVRDETIGVLTVWDASARPWSENERQVLAGLAAQGGQAIARAQAYEAQAAAARTLQESLLPSRLPEAAGLDLAARYVPAEDGLLVGGDWYDCLVLEDGRVALVVGDVMGKGLHAAALMGQIRIAVRSFAALDPSPSAVLTALHNLNTELAADEIVTMVYVLIDPATGEARVARAGHLPPLLVTSAAGSALEVQVVEAGGSAPLGSPSGAWKEAEFAMPHGSLLVLFTDGLVEDRATGLERGMAELTAALHEEAGPGRTVDDLASRLLRACRHQSGQDDIALLLARRTG